jgi:hypothetical protein
VPLCVIALVHRREASTEMKGYDKYIVAALALAGGATFGLSSGSTPVQAEPQPAEVAAGGTPVAAVATGTDYASFGPFGSVLRRIDASKPHVLEGPIADIVVRIRGRLCSGTPITGTRYVVTAAHCVLEDDGDVATRFVERYGVRYRAESVLVDPRYVDRPVPELDAAVIVLSQAIPGPSARLGDTLPTEGLVTLAGLQEIDTDGSLLRGTGPHDVVVPKGATGTHREVEVRPTGCVESIGTIVVTEARLTVHCGLIPGASGGGLYVERNGGIELVGIVSTVNGDISANGVVPLSSLHELLDNPGRYTYEVPKLSTDNTATRLALT